MAGRILKGMDLIQYVFGRADRVIRQVRGSAILPGLSSKGFWRTRPLPGKGALSGNRRRDALAHAVMEEVVRPVATQCPMTAALIAIGGKWNLICLYWLDEAPRRFNELRRLMPDISHKVLAETLRVMEQEGLIVRTVHALAPSHVDYRISPYGETVRPLMHAVRHWGRAHLEWRAANQPAVNPA